MSLIVDILACPTPEQVLIYLSEMSEQELGEALDEVELVNAGDRRSKIRRLRNYVFRIKGFSGEGFSDTSSNATRDNSVDLGDIRRLSAHDLENILDEIPGPATAPVTVTASEFIPSCPITTMAGTMSRGAEGYVTVSDLAHGVTTSRITPSALAMPAGLALAYGYANITYTGPRDSLHLPNPIFPPTRPSRTSVEITEEDVRPSVRGVPSSEQRRETSYQDTVRGGPDKPSAKRNFSPLVPPAAQYSTLDSSSADRLDRVSEGFGNRGGPIRDGRLDLHLNLDTNLETINQTGAPDELTHGPSRVGDDSEGGPNRFSRYEADFRSLNLDGYHGQRTREDQGQRSRLPVTGGPRNDDMFHEDTGLHERGHMSGYPENRGLGLTSSRFEPRREIQDLSRFIYNWKISFSGKPGASVEDFLTRLEECRGITPISDDDLLRALPLLLKDVALLWFRISGDEWRNWPEFKVAFRRRFGNFDFEARVREQIVNRTQGPKESMDDYLTHLRGLIAKLTVRVPLNEQMDWAHRGLRPEFKKEIRKFEFRDFNELAQIGRSWEMAWAAIKEYRLPPPPESSFLPEFAYRSENSSAAHKRTSTSAISETATPPRNSGGSHLGSQDTKGQGSTDGHDPRNKGHPMGFPRDKPKPRGGLRSPKNPRGTGSDFKVGGGHQSSSTSAEKASKDSCTEKEVICFRCQKPGHYQAGCPLPRKLACYRCKTEGYTTKNCPKCSGNGEKKQ